MNKNPKKTRRTAQISRITDITRHYRRITLTSEQRINFPTDQIGGYIKLILPTNDQQEEPMRTYTVRYFRNEVLELDVDFVLHEDSGPASEWAENAYLGQSIDLLGPGPKSIVDLNADWFLMAGDMTALPAISINLERLPPHSQGTAIIEVKSKDDIQKLIKPDSIDIIWIINSAPGLNSELLSSAVRTIEWQTGVPGVWVACEFKAMKLLRNYFLKERGLNRKSFYISSYWKHGISEDHHKLLKKADSNATPTS